MYKKKRYWYDVKDVFSKNSRVKNLTCVMFWIIDDFWYLIALMFCAMFVNALKTTEKNFELYNKRNSFYVEKNVFFDVLASIIKKNLITLMFWWLNTEIDLI